MVIKKSEMDLFKETIISYILSQEFSSSSSNLDCNIGTDKESNEMRPPMSNPIPSMVPNTGTSQRYYVLENIYIKNKHFKLSYSQHGYWRKIFFSLVGSHSKIVLLRTNESDKNRSLRSFNVYHLSNVRSRTKFNKSIMFAN